MACACAHAADADTDSFSRLFDFSAAIPGTREYRLQKTSRQLSTLLVDLDAVEDARVIVNSAGDERLSALITLHLASAETWDGEMSSAVLTLLQGGEPSLDTGALQIIDSRGRVLYTDGHPLITEHSHSTAPGSPNNAPVSAMTVIAVGLIVGLLAAGAWWFAARRGNRRPDTDASHNPWRFLRDADSETIADVFSDLRMEMASAIIGGLDEATREHVLQSLPTHSRSADPPSQQMHPDIETVLQRLLHRRCNI
ncbi:MAG: hypothetical protein ACLFWB_11355 [Armatimonadota bacterium]